LFGGAVEDAYPLGLDREDVFGGLLLDAHGHQNQHLRRCHQLMKVKKGFSHERFDVGLDKMKWK